MWHLFSCHLFLASRWKAAIRKGQHLEGQCRAPLPNPGVTNTGFDESSQTDWWRKKSSTCGSFATYHMSRNLGRLTLRPRSARSVCDLSYHLALWKPMPRFKTVLDTVGTSRFFLRARRTVWRGRYRTLCFWSCSVRRKSAPNSHPGAVSFASSFLIAWQQIKSFRHMSSGVRTASVEPHLRRPFY